VRVAGLTQPFAEHRVRLAVLGFPGRLVEGRRAPLRRRRGINRLVIGEKLFVTGPPLDLAEGPVITGELPAVAGVLVPVKRPARGELDINTRTRNALLRSLRYQGERGFALISQRWRVMQHVTVSPGTIGDIAKAALVLVQFEHKMIS
jgi:hypothetical protein